MGTKPLMAQNVPFRMRSDPRNRHHMLLCDDIKKRKYQTQDLPLLSVK